MANAYFDLGNWNGFTPYIGGGIGAANVTISDFQDVNVQAGAYGYAKDHSTWNFAWAINPGVAYEITPKVTLDLSYRFLSLGNASTSDMLLPNGQNQVYNPIQFKGIYSNDAMFTIRYAFN
jgi:opacity protein-like surface antigen